LHTPDEGHLSELIARAKAGDRDAWGEIYVLVGENMRRRIRRMLGQRIRVDHESMDVVDSVLKELPDRLRNYQHESAEGFLGWLSKQLVRKVLDQHRKKGTLKGGGAHQIERGEEALKRLEAQNSQDSTPSQAAGRNEEKELLARGLSRLDPAEREILRLDLDGKSFIELARLVAEAEGKPCSADAARMRLQRARARLAQEVRKIRKGQA